MSDLEDLFEFHLKTSKILGYEREYRFRPDRRWRLDFAFPDRQQPFAVEIEGGTWVNGGHSRGAAFEKDCEKYNELALMRWNLLRFTTDMVKDGRAIETVRRYLGV